MRLAVSRDDRRIGRMVKIKKPERYSDGIKAIQKAAFELSDGQPIKGVVGGIAGVLDKKHTQLYRSPHLKGWLGKPLKRELERIFKAPVWLENDADLIGLGEAHCGAGRGYSIIASIAIGTGIGGTRIVDGRIDRNALGFEPGHQYLDISIRKHKHVSPHPGDWESLVSGSALRLKYGRPAEQISDPKVWNKMNELIGLGLINICLLWSPEVIILGGSLMNKLSLVQCRQIVKRRLKLYPAIPKIVRSRLGDQAGLLGALAYLKQQRPSIRQRSAR